VVLNVAWWCSSTGQVWAWRYTPFIGVWVLAGALVGGYVVAHRRAGRPLDPGLTRRFVLGVLAIVAVSEWPIGALGAGYLASVGMLRYLVYTFVAAPLLVSSIPGWLLRQWAPPGSRRGRALALVTAWPVALLLFNSVMVGTHLPPIVDGLKVYQAGSFALDLLWLVAALAWWWPAMRPDDEPGAIREPIRAFYLFTSSVLMFVPAAFLTFAPLPLYGLYELAPPLWLGFDPVADQQSAGIIMNVGGGLVLWAIIGTLFFRWATTEQHADADAKRQRDARTLRRMAAMETADATAGARGSGAVGGQRPAPDAGPAGALDGEPAGEPDPTGSAHG